MIRQNFGFPCIDEIIDYRCLKFVNKRLDSRYVASLLLDFKFLIIHSYTATFLRMKSEGSQSQVERRHAN